MVKDHRVDRVLCAKCMPQEGEMRMANKDIYDTHDVYTYICGHCGHVIYIQEFKT